MALLKQGVQGVSSQMKYLWLYTLNPVKGKVWTIFDVPSSHLYYYPEAKYLTSFYVNLFGNHALLWPHSTGTSFLTKLHIIQLCFFCS